MPIEKFVYDSDFQNLMKGHIFETIELIYKKEHYFGITCQIEHVSFVPPLPTELISTFPEITLFMLAEYSYESSKLTTETLSFEAGFGESNFGSIVTIPLLAIKQVFLEEYLVALNVAEYTQPIKEEVVEEDTINSMEMLLKNPNNAKLLKHKKKKL